MKTLLPLSILFAILFSGCNQVVDYYDNAYAVCNHRINAFHSLSGAAVTAVPVFDKYPECKTYLQSIIHFDEKSFANAPVWMKDKFLEALQVLVAYPIDYPSNDRIFGLDPGSIPPNFIHHVLESETGLNRSLFNYVLSLFDTVYYNPNDDGTHSALFGIDGASAAVTLFPHFFTPTPVGPYKYISPFERASFLVHEAWHGSSVFHVTCQDGTFECDDSLNGPYGTESIYLTMLLHGSFHLKETDGSNYLTNDDVSFIERVICTFLKRRVHSSGKATDLDELLNKTDCRAMTYENALKIENLSR